MLKGIKRLYGLEPGRSEEPVWDAGYKFRDFDMIFKGMRLSFASSLASESNWPGAPPHRVLQSAISTLE